jgi:hypothetical protein
VYEIRGREKVIPISSHTAFTGRDSRAITEDKTLMIPKFR